MILNFRNNNDESRKKITRSKIKYCEILYLPLIRKMSIINFIPNLSIYVQIEKDFVQKNAIIIINKLRTARVYLIYFYLLLYGNIYLCKKTKFIFDNTRN